jgi:hypothetical protein
VWASSQARKLRSLVATLLSTDRAVAKLIAHEGADATIVHLPKEEEDAPDTKKMLDRVESAPLWPLISW